MGKWEKYKKKHNREWEQEHIFQGWLTKNDKDETSSYCKWCDAVLRAHRGDLQKHAATNKHKQQMAKMDKSQLSLTNVGVSLANKSTKKKEVTLACYIAAHTTIRSIDHLTDIINNFNEKNATSSSHTEELLHLHRTKCTAIIKNVIAPSLLRELVKDIGDSKFSIIVDESTDVSTEKLLCICIKYYSYSKNDMVTQFLGFLSVVQTTAQDLYQVIFDFFSCNNLNLKNLIGVGTDGASNLCGQHNSLYTLLKTNLVLKSLILVKCICHSLNLCTSKASEVFSDEVDFLLKETYNWFKNSTLRVSKYREIYSLINTDNNFTKLTQLSTTRWLSRYRAVDKVLSQYLELETFFLISAQKEKCHTAKLLSDSFKDKKNKVILTFLKPLLKQMFYLNLYFQKCTIDYYQAFNDINTTIWTLARQIIKPSIISHFRNDLESLVNSMNYEQNYLNINECDLGYEFPIELRESNLNSTQIMDLKYQCFNFIKTLQELIKRMPTHLDVFGQIKQFSPLVILNHLRPKFSELPLHLNSSGNLSDLEIQYRNLLNIDWQQIFDGNIPDDSIIFWKKVISLKNAAGELMFKDISLLAFNMLSLPSSNAIVERSFSIMNIVKCKLRNKMMLKLLNAIMMIRYHFYANNICCKSFIPTNDMLVRFTSTMYKEDLKTSDDDEEVLSLCQEIL